MEDSLLCCTDLSRVCEHQVLSVFRVIGPTGGHLEPRSCVRKCHSIRVKCIFVCEIVMVICSAKKEMSNEWQVHDCMEL